jgi:hypothetical protein
VLHEQREQSRLDAAPAHETRDVVGELVEPGAARGDMQRRLHVVRVS